MKEKILKLIKEKPKHYVKIIANNDLLLEWINTNTLISSDHLPSKIFSAIYQQSNICKFGNIKKFDRISTGFIGCGPAKSCICTADNISKNVSLSKSKYTTEEKIKTNDKRRTSMLEKYGVEFNSQREDKKHIWNKPKIPLTVHSKLIDYTWMNNEYNIKKRSLTEIAAELDVYYSTVAEYCHKFGFIIRPTSLRSLEEIQIVQYIKSLGCTQIEESNRTIIAPKELDIFIPQVNLAIEVNGLRWHSHHPSLGKPEDRYKHLTKTTNAAIQGITLIHVTDYEWKHKQEIIKSIIQTRLGLNEKIHARKCEIKQIDKITEREFLNKYHIQGYIPSNTSFGLFYKSELIMIMTLGKSRFKVEYDFELLRMCTKSNFTIIGGVSKLVSYLKKLYPLSTIVSYCDLSKGTGTGYLKAGFELIGKTKPGYFWTNGNNVVSRYKSQKSNLKNWLDSFDSLKSEAVNMFDANYRRYWDCGNAIFILKT